jgi:hypothetical protein
MTNEALIASVAQIESQIYLIRGQKVMLDEDLAALHDVEIKVLNQAVKRNLDRFPDDFMFQLSAEKFADLRSQSDTSSLKSQIVTLKSGRGQHRKYSLTHLPSRVCPCSPAYCAALVLFMSTSKSCVLLCAYGRCWLPMQSFPANWLRSKRTTTSNSKQYLKPSAN